MIVDYLAGIGSFAFRRVPDSDVQGVLEVMDREGIDVALVSALEAVMYRNVQSANELLAERIDSNRDRLIGAAVVNPTYPRAPNDAELCLTKLGMKALRLYPGYHGYRLGKVVTTGQFGEAMSIAANNSAPVSIAFQVEDVRQRHVLVNPEPVAPEDVVSVIASYPAVTFVLERIGYGQFMHIRKHASDAANWLVETSGRFLAVRPRTANDYPHRGLPDLIEALGPDRVLFGTDMPLQYSQVARMKLDALDLDKEARAKIQGGNAARLLRIA